MKRQFSKSYLQSWAINFGDVRKMSDNVYTGTLYRTNSVPYFVHFLTDTGEHVCTTHRHTNITSALFAFFYDPLLKRYKNGTSHIKFR